MKKILVIGSSSLVGSHFVKTFSQKYCFSAIGRRNIFSSEQIRLFSVVDIRDQIALREAISAADADVVVNYAAETDVDKCELEKGDVNGNAFVTNCLAASWVAEACLAYRKELCHVSTDFVFDGSSGPYSEDDEAGPVNSSLSWYGHTKFLAERKIANLYSNSADSAPRWLIIRLSYPYRSDFKYKEDFARKILRLYGAKLLYPLYTDQVLSPTLINDFSDSLNFLINNPDLSSGFYHVASRNTTTPFDFGCSLISRYFGVVQDEIKGNVKKGSIIQSKMGPKAPRPVLGGLKSEKIQRAGFSIRTFQENIEEFCREARHLV